MSLSLSLYKYIYIYIRTLCHYACPPPQKKTNKKKWTELPGQNWNLPLPQSEFRWIDCTFAAKDIPRGKSTNQLQGLRVLRWLAAPPPRWYGPQVVILLVVLLIPLLLHVLVLLLLLLLILILRSARSTSTITTTSTSTSTTTIIVTTRTSTTIPHPHHRRVGGCHPTLYHIFELWIEIFETTSDDVVVTHSRYNSAKNTRKDSQSSMAMGSDALNSKGVISPPCYPFLPDLSVWLVINLARKNIIC